MMSGELVGLDSTGTYTISADGVIAASGGGTAADLVITHGAGSIVVADYDPDGTGTAPENAIATMKFIFGDSARTVANGGINIIGAVSEVACDVGSGTVGSAVCDHIVPSSVTTITGNAVTVQLGALYEVEGGTQIPIVAGSIMKFTLICFARGGVA
jgi:hypothetical protein